MSLHSYVWRRLKPCPFKTSPFVYNAMKRCIQGLRLYSLYPISKCGIHGFRH